ncbi:hypothetical protein [Pandoraea pnomenusa]|uniref:hypothetical protein n=1 Tax=Pandoraea pnomenusa TaxID=93220 RepID=UPI0033405809
MNIAISKDMAVGSAGLRRASYSSPVYVAAVADDLFAVRQGGCTAAPEAARSAWGRSPESPAEVRTVALLTGVATRRHLHVKGVAPGLVLVRVAGDEGCFRRVGLDAAFVGQAGYQRLAYVAAAMPRHEGTVLASDTALRTMTCFADDMLGASNRRAGALINGAFFNFQRRADAARAEHTPIGALRTAQCVHDSLPIPRAYAGDYVRLRLSDDSYIESTPLLSINGAPVFFPTRCQTDGYRLPDDFSFETGCIRPGELLHAADPNPRAGISVPVTSGDEWVRLVVGLACGRGAQTRSGYSLASWSSVMARIDRLGETPHVSINLDGGNSIALVVSDGKGGRVHIGQPKQDRHIGSALAFVADAGGTLSRVPDTAGNASHSDGDNEHKKGQPSAAQGDPRPHAPCARSATARGRMSSQDHRGDDVRSLA